MCCKDVFRARGGVKNDCFFHTQNQGRLILGAKVIKKVYSTRKKSDFFAFSKFFSDFAVVKSVVCVLTGENIDWKKAPKRESLYLSCCIKGTGFQPTLFLVALLFWNLCESTFQ